MLFEEEDTRPYECDGLSAYRQLPMVVALPENEAQVQRVLETCRALNVPVVPRGAGTGLSGGALPIGDGVLLSTRELQAHRCASTRSRAPRVVQPGVRNLAISEAAAPYGLYYAPDPSSQIACTIGGNVAENSGGVHCLKYGLTVHNVLRRARGAPSTASRRARQRGARRAGLRPARARHRLRRHAGRGHRSDGEAAAEAAVRARDHGLVRRRGEGAATRSPT